MVGKQTAILIPARYGSTRFPGKPLAMLDGVPMIKRVYDACVASNLPTYVLTDDMRIFNLFGPDKCWIDQTDYANGTERCAGAISNDFFAEYGKFINVQGDMPDVTVEMIEGCSKRLSYNYSVSTVYTDMPREMQDDPNSVKMVQAYPNQALWFGRGLTGYGEWHLGVYGYSRTALETYPTLRVTQEETVEQLEQLRWLKSGWRIGCNRVYFNGVEINTPEDVEKWEGLSNEPLALPTNVSQV
jgi:3-deoxy-manno-octulosonate cytidylyltransferase (CMP-KDO synthetase)